MGWVPVPRPPARRWCASGWVPAPPPHRWNRRAAVEEAPTQKSQPPPPPTTIGVLESEADFVRAINATAGSDLIVIKFFAPWCRACRGLDPKYKRLSVEYAAKGGGVQFFELSHKTLASAEGGSEFLQKHEINVLPLIHMYARGQRVEAFPCGPRKIELLREKLERWHHFADREEAAPPPPPPPREEEPPPALPPLPVTASAQLSPDELRVAWSALEAGFRELGNDQLGALLAEARTATYESGDVLVAEGEIGRRFFVLLEGECDVYQQQVLTSENRLSGFSPDATRTAYGARTNVLARGAFFGERALVENRPRVASIVAATRVKALAVERSALADAGVLDYLQKSRRTEWGYERVAPPPAKTNQKPLSLDPLSVMQRLRLVRSVVRAFDQAASRSPAWGDEAEKAYRRHLVDQLTDQQRLEFEHTFDLLDKNNDGTINLDELRDLMRAFGRVDLQDADLTDMIDKANPELEGNAVLVKQDFIALMAQAEFSSMFLETFKLLDPAGHGWLEAEQLWRVLETLVGKSFHSDEKHLSALADRFGVDDGVIDYQAFVRILLMSPAALSFP
ncbi:hypothetical protein CTAYLR_002658 [Chrysophaeum taylorii]|uniref:Calmodulin n=1 Tax=Chrysophaeum taylorii TaxID=2483200 RepID=A0AAD7UBJ3_9STRA|nr:hypothetical protein CTAYLR_002658 [Chrysophaeum taylorii]